MTLYKNINCLLKLLSFPIMYLENINTYKVKIKTVNYKEITIFSFLLMELLWLDLFKQIRLFLKQIQEGMFAIPLTF